MERELALKIEADLRQLQENRKRQNPTSAIHQTGTVLTSTVTPNTVAKPKSNAPNQVPKWVVAFQLPARGDQSNLFLDKTTRSSPQSIYLSLYRI